MAVAPASPGRLDRLSRAVPLLTAFLWLCVLYGWQTRGRATPWLFSDELKFTQISRAIADTGHPAQRGHPAALYTLYTYVIAPFWRIGSTADAYTAIKYVGVIVMTSTIFPAYFLARMIVSKPWALFAATATVAAPALAYGTFLLAEPLAYPWATLCLFLIVKALAARTQGWIIGAGAACLVAPYVRGQLSVLIGVYVLAALFVLWTSERARRWRSGWSRWDWIGAAVLGIGAVILFSAIEGSRNQEWLIATGYYRHRMIVYGLWAAGALTIGLGVLPVVALGALVRRRGEVWTRELKAFAAVTAASVIAFGLYTAVKASYVSTVFSTLVEERNLIYLAPLLFTATAFALSRGGLRWWAIAGSAGFALYVLLTTPYQLDLWPYSDALGFAIVQMANRDLAFTDGDVKVLLSVVLAISIALLFAPRLLRGRGRAAGVVAAGTAALVLAWNLAGEISASNGVNVFSHQAIGNFPKPTNWLDRATHGQPTVYLGQQITDPLGLWLMEFWNPSLHHVWSLDATAPRGSGFFLTPDAGPDGRLTSRTYPQGAPPGVDYIVADRGIDVVGTVVASPVVRSVITEDQFGFPIHKVVVTPAPWRVLRIDQPLRLHHAVLGIDQDGWAGALTAYSQFSTAGNRPGWIKVVVSRAAWRGPDKPGNVTVKIGRLVRGPDKQPALGHVTAVRRFVIHAGKTRVVFLPASPPARVEVRVSPTFSPHDYGSSDRRHLGAQVTYTFSEKRPPGR